MSNQAVIEDLLKAKDAAMRVAARALIKAYSNEIEDFVQVLGEELSKLSTDHAIRTGDYERAATLHLIAGHLARLDRVLENYDGAESCLR